MPNSSTCTEWSITSSTGCSGLIRRGSPPMRGHGVAHGGQVDHGGHAGEVLQQHAGGHEGDLARRRGLRAPSRPAPRCRRRVTAGAVLAAQQVLEQDAQRVGQRATSALPGACRERRCDRAERCDGCESSRGRSDGVAAFRAAPGAVVRGADSLAPSASARGAPWRYDPRRVRLRSSDAAPSCRHPCCSSPCRRSSTLSSTAAWCCSCTTTARGASASSSTAPPPSRWRRSSGMEIEWGGEGDVVAHFGGPVQPQLGTVLFRPRGGNGEDPAASAEVIPGVSLTQHVGDAVAPRGGAAVALPAAARLRRLGRRTAGRGDPAQRLADGAGRRWPGLRAAIPTRCGARPSNRWASTPARSPPGAPRAARRAAN